MMRARIEMARGESVAGCFTMESYRPVDAPPR
jgi:hypothetical protein